MKEKLVSLNRVMRIIEVEINKGCGDDFLSDDGDWELMCGRNKELCNRCKELLEELKSRLAEINKEKIE